MQARPTLVLAATLTAAATAQNHIVVPVSATTNDAMSYEWVAGATRPLRQQTLVDQVHLTPMVGQVVQAIELRRHAATEAYQAGSANLTVTLSISPNTALGCSSVYADNIGTNAVTVFAGAVTFPASPAAGGSGTPVAWSSSNTIRIAFSTPFLYLGGTLCVDIVGQPIAGQDVWWMADAIEQGIPGANVAEIGTGCGIYGGPQHSWSEVAMRSLVPGGRALFRAEGPPNGFALAVFGWPAAAPIPLSAFGISSPGCFCHLNPSAILAAVPAMFVPEVHPASIAGALADLFVALPADPAWFGVSMSTQWFDLTQLATSNAITWTIANAVPSLGMALNEGPINTPNGLVTTYLAPVLRFEYQ